MKFSPFIVLAVSPVLGAAPLYSYFADGDFAAITPPALGAAPGPTGADCEEISPENICTKDSVTPTAVGRTAWATAIVPPAGFDWTKPDTKSVVITGASWTSACVPGATATDCAYHPNLVDITATAPAPFLAQIMPKSILDNAGIDSAKNCLFQWNIGGLSVTPDTSTTTIQGCQALCFADATCEVWTYKQKDATTGDCYMYDASIWDALGETPGASAGASCKLTSDGTETSIWATCEADPTIKICAKLDGTSVSGRKICDETQTPTLTWLQGNATAVCNPVATTATPSPDAETTTPTTTTTTTSGGSDGDVTTGISSGASSTIVLGGAVGVAMMMAMF